MDGWVKPQLGFVLFFLKFCVFVLFFVVVHVSKQIKNWVGGRVGGVRVFLEFLDFFLTWQNPLAGDYFSFLSHPQVALNCGTPSSRP